jgi:hypothetical protein
MRARSVIAGATAVALAAIGAVSMPAAHAVTDDMPLNGTFIAKSMGEWARTNESYHDEVPVESTWTISSTCVSPSKCDGTVTSDAGWSAPLTIFAGVWEIHRELANWAPCPDGVTAMPGHQTIRFYGVDYEGAKLLRQSDATIFAGEDRTIGDSGACGQNRWQVVRMPFVMRKVA